MTLDFITTDVIDRAFAYACEEMGIALRNTAFSPNIKERLDHSCALFDAECRLIAQAEHIPVHLGSLPWGLRRCVEDIDARGGFAPGRMWVINDPYLTGTHLNDVTVIRPIFFQGTLAGFAANKAHHTDVGGAVPGSISADAGDLYAEGLVVPPTLLVEGDRCIDETVALFAANSRAPKARGGDLRAQIAANVTGERRFIGLLERYGRSTVAAAAEDAMARSERRMRAALREFGQGLFEAEDVLEARDGDTFLRLRASLELDDGTARFSYDGTAAQVDYPMNAVFGVTLSGIYYVLRTIVGGDVSMNDGCFRPIQVDVPEGTLLNPRRPAPVGGGNVETSTRNADLVLALLAAARPDRIPAFSGGTMSNVMLGGTRANAESWAFYETIGCGMGARPTLPGIDAIQCHMTNTLNTPVEALERAFPLRVERYEIVEGTGGSGRYSGGCGMVRTLRVTEGEAYVSLLADRHRVPPRGACGGGAGHCGAHALYRDGVRTPLPAKTGLRLRTGDAIEIRTPGGGGYGAC
ncbi:MAG: hydantoinase B/oxoprolinase family protein [Candidatus Eremiobacteraeota bacterium]|nr:hydantoinase B/oxoprolinase family protein [Candidatus Eremiobacteraeota bacterium]